MESTPTPTLLSLSSSGEVANSDANITTTSSSHEENQYLDLIREILEHGILKDNRTGVKTKNLFGKTLRFSLQNNTMPLLTTKKVFWKGVVEELLWLIRGDTNAKHLSEKAVNIWDANGSREYLDSHGFEDREEGDLGPIYGFQWRHFGAKYMDMNTDYTGQGVDQLQQCIDMIRNDPNSRRIVVNAWNATDIPGMSLPPCHVLFQFFVSNGELSCLMFQRSCDMGVGVPFNIASYALLTHMIAHVCGLKAKELVHVMGDVHVYMTHADALKEQLTRTPYPFPTLSPINEDIKDIDAFKACDLSLINYQHHPALKMKMAV